MTIVRRPGVALMAAVAAVCMLALMTNVLPFSQIRDQQRELELARVQLDEIADLNHQLSSRVAALNTPVEVERIARERLGYVRPGETAYVVMEPETPQVAPKTVTTDQGSALYSPWYEKLWGFITGADL